MSKGIIIFAERKKKVKEISTFKTQQALQQKTTKKKNKKDISTKTFLSMNRWFRSQKDLATIDMWSKENTLLGHFKHSGSIRLVLLPLKLFLRGSESQRKDLEATAVGHKSTSKRHELVESTRFLYNVLTLVSQKVISIAEHQLCSQGHRLPTVKVLQGPISGNGHKCRGAYWPVGGWWMGIKGKKKQQPYGRRKEERKMSRRILNAPNTGLWLPWLMYHFEWEVLRALNFVKRIGWRDTMLSSKPITRHFINISSPSLQKQNIHASFFAAWKS